MLARLRSTGAALEQFPQLVEQHNRYPFSVLPQGHGAHRGDGHQEVLVKDLAAEDAVGGLPQDVVADDEVGDQAQCKAEPAGGGDKLYRDNQYGGEDQPQQDLFLFVCHRKTSRWNGERRWLKENLAVPLHLAAGGEDRFHGLLGSAPSAKATCIFWAIKLTATSAMPGPFWQRIPFLRRSWRSPPGCCIFSYETLLSE